MPTQLIPSQEGDTHLATSQLDVTFSKNFAFEVALQYEPLPTIMQRYNITRDQLLRLRKHKPFVVAVRTFQKEIAENGISFRLKSKVMAEDLLSDAYLMAKDRAIPASVRMKGIENVVRWGELEPAKNVDPAQSGTTFQVMINL